jgi:wobble nucleotide-excising tRNase
MITNINKIKNLGLVFSNYTLGTGISSFKQFNLIYGWNGSGKTTLSRLFDAIGGVSIENLEYEIEDDQGNKYKQGEVFPRKLRIFNQDYIRNNVKILESRTNSISILLGEENRGLIEKIENDKKLLDGDPDDPNNQGKTFIYIENTKEKKRKSTERDGKFTEIAKTIGAAIGGNALRDYRKPQAEIDFATLTVKTELSDNDLKKCLASVKQESLPQINTFILQKVKISDEEMGLEIPSLLILIVEEAKTLLIKTVESETILRLSANEDISGWVEQGLGLHKKHSSDFCEYCWQKIPITRTEQLSHHFNEADKKMKDDLGILEERLQKIYSIIQYLQAPDRARFYSNLQDSFDTKVSNFESAKQQILSNITKFIEELRKKKGKTTETFELKSAPDIENFSMRIDEVNQIINTHNKITSDFEDVKKETIQKLKVHYLSTIFDDVKKLDSDILKLDKNLKLLNEEILNVRKRITENMTQISSEHKACEIINEKLATFLGYQEINFIPHTEKETGENGEEKEVVTGYHIMRGDKPAVYLSEGEKTAIAFVYFIVHLGDQNFKVDNGIIIIDDPISSLDSNSLYQAFSFMKNAIKDGEQVFVLTHSFDFLKLLINWRRHAGETGYYMIKNNFPNNIRCAYIDKMDKELCEYESEYHYLFKLLKQLRDEQDNSIAKAYPVPNIARKVWDTFLMFSVPNGESSYKKMDYLKEAKFNSQKLDAIYKFTNDQSHVTGSGFNPALVPETKKVVKELFEMMEAISPDHFKIIDAVTN